MPTGPFLNADAGGASPSPPLHPTHGTPYTAAMRCCLPAVFSALLLLFAAAPLRAQSARPGTDETTQSALYVLRQAFEVKRNGDHNVLLRALRQLEDPALAPVFVRLAQAKHPHLRIHGLLGLAEISPEKRLDLAVLADLTDGAEQGEIVTAALDSELLRLEDAAAILDWKSSGAVQLLVATRLIAANQFEARHQPLLVEQLRSDSLGRRSLAALLLHQLGDPAGTAALSALDRSEDPSRDAVRAMLLQTAIQNEFAAAGRWAYAIATEPQGNSRLQMLALRAALRLKDPRAGVIWQQHFQSSTDLADQTRLAILALQQARHTPPELFAVLQSSAAPLIQQIGRTGQAIAAARADALDQIVALIDQQHPVTNSWALGYAQQSARPADAQLIMFAMVMAYQSGPQQGGAKRLNDAVEATTWLFDNDPAAAAALLHPILADPHRDEKLAQGILLGLVRARGFGAEQVIRGVPPFMDPTAGHLAVLLLAKRNAPLDARQQRDLELLVRGGGSLHSSLRAQAAWVYLNRTGQAQRLLELVPAG